MCVAGFTSGPGWVNNDDVYLYIMIRLLYAITYNIIVLGKFKSKLTNQICMQILGWYNFTCGIFF